MLLPGYEVLHLKNCLKLHMYVSQVKVIHYSKYFLQRRGMGGEVVVHDLIHDI